MFYYYVGTYMSINISYYLEHLEHFFEILITYQLLWGQAKRSKEFILRIIN